VNSHKKAHTAQARRRVVLLVYLGIITFLLFDVMRPRAQEGPPPATGGRRGGNIREFLGLGPPPDPVAAERGEKIYAASCAFCHGPKARGAEAPSLVRSVMLLHDERGETIGPFLLKGRPDRGMPAFPALSESQTFDIAQFLHMQVELAANRGSYKRLSVVTGDAKRGEAYFNGTGKCNTCHSPTGDLAKIGSKYPPEQLQTRFLWPEGGGFGSPSRVRKATVTLPSGEKISGTIKRIDDFHISVYDANGDFHSWSREPSREGGAIRVEVEDRMAAHRLLLEKYSDDDIHNLTAYLVTLK
jgi:cytochrome c oxidase cbb3-type subunit III